MGYTVLPSVKASTETSGPVRNSSTTTRLPDAPNCLVLHDGLDSVLALLPRSRADQYALAQRQAVRLDHDRVAGSCSQI